MQIERLKLLAQKLREDAANPNGIKFEIGVWYGDVDGAKPVSCGTTACAMGLAALSPEFQAMGLKPQIIKSKYNPAGDYLNVEFKDKEGRMRGNWCGRSFL